MRNDSAGELVPLGANDLRIAAPGRRFAGASVHEGAYHQGSLQLIAAMRNDSAGELVPLGANDLRIADLGRRFAGE